MGRVGDVGKVWENIFKDASRAGCDIIAVGNATPRFPSPVSIARLTIFPDRYHSPGSGASL